jgi:hypothetical protein
MQPAGTTLETPPSEEALMSETPPDRPPDSPPPGPPAGPPPSPPASPGYQAYPAARQRRNGIGIAALVCGVVALVLVLLILFAPLGVILGLVAVVLGILGLTRANRGEADNRGQAVAGLVTGGLAVLIGLFLAVSIGTFFATNVNDFREFGRCMDNARSDQARQACAEQLANNLDR